jgi:hypothetical protein
MAIREINIQTGVETTRDYTQEELDAFANLPQTDPKESIRAQIKQLEAEQLMPRATREFMLTFMEMNAPAEVLAVNPGYQAVKAFDNEIKALRDLL